VGVGRRTAAERRKRKDAGRMIVAAKGKKGTVAVGRVEVARRGGVAPEGQIK